MLRISKAAERGSEATDRSRRWWAPTVRRLRAAQGLTLRKWPASADISAAMLSRLERRRCVPQPRDAGGAGRGAGHRLRDAAARARTSSRAMRSCAASGEGLEVVRRGTRAATPITCSRRTAGRDALFEPFLVTLTSKSEMFPEFDHPGVEFIHILEGSLRYRHGTGELPAQARRFPDLPGRCAARAGQADQAADAHALDHRLRRRGRRGLIRARRSPHRHQRRAPLPAHPPARAPARDAWPDRCSSARALRA